MVETHIDDSETVSVYQAHKNQINAARGENLNNIIEQIRTYANMKISESDAGYVKCSTVDDLDVVCAFIAANENIVKSRVYPALRLIGYNNRYHHLKLGDPNILEDRSNLMKRRALTLDRNITSAIAEETPMFGGTKKRSFRMNKDAVAISTKDAERYSVRTSDLNMYHVLHGVKLLVRNEPDYILLRDNEYFKIVLTTLDRAESLMKWNNQLMEKMLE